MKKKLLPWMLAGCMAVSMPGAVLAAENAEEAGAETETASEAALSGASGETGETGPGDDIYSVRGRSAEGSHDL